MVYRKSDLCTFKTYSAFEKQIMEITRIGSRPSGKGPDDWFTGAVRIDPLFEPNDARRAASALVTFEPGAERPGIHIRWAKR